VSPRPWVHGKPLWGRTAYPEETGYFFAGGAAGAGAGAGAAAGASAGAAFFSAAGAASFLAGAAFFDFFAFGPVNPNHR
jgi:hypothetical protein